VLGGHQKGVGWAPEPVWTFGGARNDDRGNNYKIVAGKPEGTEPLQTMKS